jgi:hypothetical protein
MAERDAAPADGFRKPVPGRPGVTVRPYYGGLPLEGWTGQDERGESRGIVPVKSGPSGSRKHGPRAQSRRDGAPEGVTLSGSRACSLKPLRAKAGTERRCADWRSISRTYGPRERSPRESGKDYGDRAPQITPGRRSVDYSPLGAGRMAVTSTSCGCALVEDQPWRIPGGVVREVIPGECNACV